ncbi:hypothetical protein JCM10049v2_002734 [Rhodotorula toruloides]
MSTAPSKRPFVPAITKGARGPLPSSCDGCRLRRVACRGRQTDEAGQAVRSCDACLRKGIQCTTTARQTNPRVRSGRRIEAAKEIYGSTDIATPSTPPTTRRSTPPTCSDAEAHLLNDLQVETLRLDVLDLYDRISGAAKYPLYPWPLFNYYDLRHRFESRSLMLRIVAAAASRFLRPSKGTEATRDTCADQALQLAVRLADSQGLWRTINNSNPVALLLLWQLMANGELGTSAAQPYLVAAANQVKAMRDLDQPELDDDTTTWAIALTDAVVALETSSAPILSFRFKFFSRIARMTAPLADMLLPSLDQLSRALDSSDPWDLSQCVAPVLAIACFSVRRLAYAFEDLALGNSGALRICEAEWLEMDKIYLWVDNAVAFGTEQATVTKPFCRALLELYTGLIAALTVFSEVAILRAAEGAARDQDRAVMPIADSARKRANSGVCRYLRGARTCASRNHLALFASTFYSVSRVVLLADIFVATPTWDVNLHPQGAADKLASLFFLRDALRNISLAYPSPAVTSVLEKIELEIVSLQRVVDAPLPYGDDPNTPTIPLTQVAAWTFNRTHNMLMPRRQHSDSPSISPPSQLPPQLSSSQPLPPLDPYARAPPFASSTTSLPFYVALEPPMWTFQPAHVLNEDLDGVSHAPAPVPVFPSFPDGAQAYAFPAQAYSSTQQDSYSSHFSS